MAARKPTARKPLPAPATIELGTVVRGVESSLYIGHHLKRGGQIAIVTRIYNVRMVFDAATQQWIDEPIPGAFWADLEFEDGTPCLKIGLDVIRYGTEFEVVG